MRKNCQKKTTEEKLQANKRLQIFIAICILFGVALTFIEVFTGDGVESSTVSAFCCMICVLALNTKNRKDLEEQLQAEKNTEE